MRRNRSTLITATIAATCCFRMSLGDEPQLAADLEKPVRILAAGKPIDSGEAWGHSGPCLHDVDGDGLADLVVGDFSGKFRVFHNRGSKQQPEFALPYYLMAGDVEAQVPI